MQGSGVSINPRTGKEIKILQTETSVYRDKKVLEWKEGHGVWDTISCKPVSDIWLVVDEESMEHFFDKCRQVKLVFIRKSLLKGISVEDLKENKIHNLICLEEMKDLFPQLGDAWNGSLEDAVVLIAGLLRYHHVSGLPKFSPRASQLGIQEELLPPPQLWWITQYYVPSKAKRRREIDTCLQKNLESNLINKIVLLNEKKESLPSSQKIEERVIGKRLSYSEVFKQILTFPPNVIVAFANADICIDDESWRPLWQIDFTDKALALLRYDVDEAGEAKLFGPRADSQDCWVVTSDSVRSRGEKLIKGTDIPFGTAGCDNAVAVELLRNRYQVSNPCLSVKTFHYHTSQVRGYDPQDVVDRPAYLYIAPTGIHDLNPLTKGLRLTPEGSFKVSNCFVTDGGLVFDRSSMYIGNSEEAHKMWGATGVHAITPCLPVSKGLIVPYEEEDMKKRESYLLRVLAKVLRLRKDAGIGEFLCPEGFSPLLELFDWNASNIPVLRWEKGIHLWCREAIAYPVTERKGVTGDDVEVLRSSLRGYLPEIQHAEKPRLVIVEGNGVVADEIESQLEDTFDVRVIYAGRSSVERIWDLMRGAWGVVCGGGLESWAWNWMLPRGAHVFEQGKMKGSESMALASGHTYRLCGTSTAVLEEIREANGTGSQVISGLPIVWLPSKKDGYFHHAGDSFREMARLWQSRGLCEVREHPTAVQCWWGSVGKNGVLLYDRPTHEWRLSAPMEERDYKLALFGNPKPSGQNGKPWFFWPRRPELVEELALVRKGFHKRKEGVVFYGKTENRVQAKRRQTHEWSEACSPGEWFMAKSVDEAYPFTQKQYIEKLGEARFGLCLAGYGLKCHREVECMAMGCVPLVAPECDMDNYAEPPVEGVHYIRVASPEEAKQVASQMDEATWETMSASAHAWWKRNCSCEGSFALTKRLVEE